MLGPNLENAYRARLGQRLTSMDSPEHRLQRLMAEAPYVRLLARQLLAEEADDVEQQTWLQAIQHGGERVVAPRAWLARIVRNVATSLHRVRARQRQESLVTMHDAVPSSAELMQHEEQRRMLIAAVDLLPEPLRAVVLSRYFEGLLPQAIAKRLGLPVTTVWNQLRRALQLLRERLDAEHGGNRRAWMLPLVPFAAPTHGIAAGTTGTSSGLAVGVGLGVVAMTMKAKLVAAFGVMLAVTAVALWSLRDPVPGTTEPVAKVTDNAVAQTSQLPRDAAAVPDEGAVRREAIVVGSEASASTGKLVVHVRHDDDTPAAGVTVSVRARGTDSHSAGQRQRSDAAGEVVFAAVPAGRMYVTTDRFSDRAAEIRAGETTDLDFVLGIGVLLTGTVVDATGTPVAGAQIDVRTPASSEDYEVLAVSGADGRFSVPGAPILLSVGARAAGHCASPMEFFQGRPGNHADVRLQLGPPGGCVEGLVVDDRARPIAGALVCIGRDSLLGRPLRNGVVPTLPALVRSDEDGRFRAVGVAPGTQPVAVRASPCAPWLGSCEVAANLTASLRIDLSPGGAIRGIVRTAAGEPAGSVFVKVGQGFELNLFATTTKADGSFELSGLPVGDLVVNAQHQKSGRVEQPVRTAAGTATTCDLQLSVGIELRGQIVDEAGRPVADAYVQCEAKGAGANWGLATSDAEGRFTVSNCPEGEAVSVGVQANGFEPLQLGSVHPSSGPVAGRLRRLAAATARITGVVASPEGKPVSSARVTARRIEESSGGVDITGPDGRFALGKLVPGTWVLTIVAPGYPWFLSEPMALAADANVDLGQVTMQVGGTAAVTIEGDRTGVWFQLDGANNRPSDWIEKDGTLVSQDLVPGPHRLLVSGKTVAAQVVPFLVRAGETTKVAVMLGPGTRQRFEIAPPVLDPLPRHVALTVYRGSDLLRTTGIMLRAGEASVDETCLAPGAYTVTIADGERRLASAAFTVGAMESAPLRVELR